MCPILPSGDRRHALLLILKARCERASLGTLISLRSKAMLVEQSACHLGTQKIHNSKQVEQGTCSHAHKSPCSLLYSVLNDSISEGWLWGKANSPTHNAGPPCLVEPHKVGSCFQLWIMDEDRAAQQTSQQQSKGQEGGGSFNLRIELPQNNNCMM